MKFSVRKMTHNDIPAVAKLFDDYRVFYNKDTDITAAIDFLTARHQNGESVVFVCKNENGDAIGFTQLYPLFSSTRMKRLWLLNDLFVTPKYRGHGVSKGLIDAAKALCKETAAAGLILETDKSNEIGNQLYPKTGFELDKDHNYYSWDV